MGFKKKYKITGRTDLPIIKELRQKYEEMYLFGDLDTMCKKFGVNEQRIRDLIYATQKNKQVTLSFDTIIRLSNMFDIPYEEFITYNAYVDYYRYTIDGEEDEMLIQYDVGKKWEEEVMEYYAKKNYFVYKIPTMTSGTVFDILVAKKGSVLMIECKHIEGDKLYYKSSGLLKKTDEIEHFINTTQNNVYLYIKSDKSGTFWTTWEKVKDKLKGRGYITKEDCFPCNLNNLDEKDEEEN